MLLKYDIIVTKRLTGNPTGTSNEAVHTVKRFASDANVAFSPNEFTPVIDDFKKAAKLLRETHNYKQDVTLKPAPFSEQDLIVAIEFATRLQTGVVDVTREGVTAAYSLLGETRPGVRLG
jgi:hypothetical protein